MTAIVFGPTGHVGSAVALTAHAYGIPKVILAMRDTSRPIPGLTPEFEASHSFQRIHADMSDPSTVQSAVFQTGATRAFLYTAHGSDDHMRRAIEALKAGGVEFVVYLSTGGIGPDAEAVDPENLTAWMHAQVELNLRAVYGEYGYVALRPGMFATDLPWWKGGISTGEVRLYAGDFTADWITPGDIGRVASAVLAGKSVDGSVLDLLGPGETSIREAVRVIAKAAGKEIQIVDVDAEEAVQAFVDMGTPAPLAGLIVKFLGEGLKAGGIRSLLAGMVYEEAVANLPKYMGRPATTLVEWAEENKGMFA